MRNPTELSNAILKDPTAREIIDWVAPVYGNSYVGLHIYQAIGLVLTRLKGYVESLRNEANPITAELLLDMWEQHYGLPINTALSVEQRQARLLSKSLSRGPCNPYKLAAAVSSALGGVEVDVQENVAKNTFLVNIREAVADITPAVAVIERKKPAHLIYQIRVATHLVAEADIKVAIAMTHAEFYNVEVQ